MVLALALAGSAPCPRRPPGTTRRPLRPASTRGPGPATADRTPRSLSPRTRRNHVSSASSTARASRRVLAQDAEALAYGRHGFYVAHRPLRQQGRDRRRVHVQGRPALSARIAAAIAAAAALAASSRPPRPSQPDDQRGARLGASPGSAFVELQAYRQGQNDITGAQLIAYDRPESTRRRSPSPVMPRTRRARHRLAGGTGVAGADYTFAGLGAALSPSGGAVCLPEATPPDCVSWGALSGVVDASVPGRRHPRGHDRRGAVPDPDARPRLRPRPRRRGRSNSWAADSRRASPPLPELGVPAERDCVPCGGSDATIIGTDGRDDPRHRGP